MEQEELHRLEERCIQESAPTCTAACPIHVDARAMAAHMAKGDFTAAAKILKKTVPFPGIISRVCDRPCERACRRGEAGGAISIRGLERACLQFASEFKESFPALPKKDKRIAIVGGGLSGLTAAFDLARKGYAAMVFEQGSQLGGSLWGFSEQELPRKVLTEDLAVLERVGVKVQLGVEVGKDISMDQLRTDFDAVILAAGASGRPIPGFAEGEKLQVDPDIFTTQVEGVFAAGSVCHPEAKHSPIQSISDGRRAAITVDRYLARVSLKASRSDQGSYTTRLYTNLEDIEPLPPVPLERVEAGYSSEEAEREAGRCIQCQCLECVKVCEYLNSFGSYPRKYVRQIYNNLAIVMGHRHANKLINSCSLCGLCREVCPEDLHMGLVCRAARETLVAQGKMPPSAHDFPLRDMQFSNSGKCTLHRHEPGTSESRYLFFPGCQLSGSTPDLVKNTYTFLRGRLEGGVGLMLRCCGAPAEWSGRTELFQDTLQEFRNLVVEMENPRLILACSTCFQIFKTHLPEADIASLWETLDRIDPLLESQIVPGRKVAVHDACTTRHETAIHGSVRNILQRRGFEVGELSLSRDRTECCGYGGLMFFANPELARKAIDRRTGESDLDYVAYCAMCRDYLAHRGKRVTHLLDLFFESDPDQANWGRGPGYSQRHDNRVHLKNAMLRELWGGDVEDRETYEAIRLNIPAPVQELLDNRLILAEDLQQVIEYAQATGNRLLHRETGRYLAHHKPAGVTYWVEYSPEGEDFLIHNAYSHRMEIVEDVKP